MNREGSFEVRFKLKSRQWSEIGKNMLSAAPWRDVKVVLERRADPLGEPIDEIDAFATAHGMVGLGEGWHEVDSVAANELLRRILGHALTQFDEVLSEMERDTTADHIIDTLRAHPRFFTNVLQFDEVGLVSWNPISSQHFDAAVVGIDNDFVGIVAVFENGLPSQD